MYHGGQVGGKNEKVAQINFGVNSRQRPSTAALSITHGRGLPEIRDLMGRNLAGRAANLVEPHDGFHCITNHQRRIQP